MNLSEVQLTLHRHLELITYFVASFYFAVISSAIISLLLGLGWVLLLTRGTALIL
jgi:hypothetical protein